MARTLIQIFLDAVATHRKEAQFLRKRNGRWEPIPAARALLEVECLALGLRGLGVGPGDRVALLSETRYEWAVADLAVLALGAVTVPIYPTLTTSQCRAILENADATTAIVSTAGQLAKLHEAAASLPSLHTVVHMDPVERPLAMDRSWDAVVGHGVFARAAQPLDFRSMAHLVQPDGVATIIYTSGTTGEPKGAMLTHANIASNVEACLAIVDLGPSDVSLSFLPLCHIFERMAGLYTMLAAGVTIAYAGGLDTVGDDMAEVRPTVINGVPRFYEKLHARVMEHAASLAPIPKRLFHWGLDQGRAQARARFAGRRRTLPARLIAAVADRLVARRIRARTGGRLRHCISGGAPLAPEIIEFFFAMRIPVLEGYGLTETSPVICLNRPGKEKPGSVGPPVPGVQVRIGAEGEVLTRGPHVMRGYFRNEHATHLAIRDGWFHTGDIGRLEPDGVLVITDRIKDLLVTAGGKKVAPQPLEAALKTAHWVSEAVLLGDRQPYIVCLIVPNLARIEKEAKTRHWAFGSLPELLERPEVRELYQREIDRINAGLAPFEQVKRFALLPHELTVEAGELTPTLKVKRRVIMERYADVIAGLYGVAEGRASA